MSALSSAKTISSRFAVDLGSGEEVSNGSLPSIATSTATPDSSPNHCCASST